MDRTSAIIINYKTPDLTVDCLKSLAEVAVFGFTRIIIDNNSPDNSIDLISDYLNRNNLNDSVDLIVNDKNAGF